MLAAIFVITKETYQRGRVQNFFGDEPLTHNVLILGLQLSKGTNWCLYLIICSAFFWKLLWNKVHSIYFTQIIGM